MKAFWAAAAVAILLTAPAYAQFSMGGDKQGPRTRQTEQEKREEADLDRAYKATVKSTTSTPAPKSDPWSNVRPANSAKPTR
jgi:hypothetical protein